MISCLGSPMTSAPVWRMIRTTLQLSEAARCLAHTMGAKGIAHWVMATHFDGRDELEGRLKQ
ncbi:hypothetical protein DDV93_16235 [Cereibacter johrii]|nr:hypothetical protein DDV93_16235 [Cereibacter johrii]